MANDESHIRNHFNESPMPDGYDESPMTDDFDKPPMPGFDESPMPDGFDESPMSDDSDESALPDGFDESPMSNDSDESSVPDDFDESPESDEFDESPDFDEYPVPDDFDEFPMPDDFEKCLMTDGFGKSLMPDDFDESPMSDNSDESSVPDDFDESPVPDDFEEVLVPSPRWEIFRDKSLKSQWQGIRDNLKLPRRDRVTCLAFMRLAVDLAGVHSNRLGPWVIKNRPLEPLLDFFRFMEGQRRDLYYETAVIMESFLMMAIIEDKLNIYSQLGTEFSTAQSYEDFWKSYFSLGGYSRVTPQFFTFDDQGVIILVEDEWQTRGTRREIEHIQADRHWVFDGDAAQEGIVRVRRYYSQDAAEMYRES